MLASYLAEKLAIHIIQKVGQQNWPITWQAKLAEKLTG
jgi:hypothetical protein